MSVGLAEEVDPNILTDGRIRSRGLWLKNGRHPHEWDLDVVIWVCKSD